MFIAALGGLKKIRCLASPYDKAFADATDMQITGQIRVFMFGAWPKK